MAKITEVLSFLWENRDWISKKLSEIRKWFGKGKGTPKSPGILILGPGGAGKTTLARLLTEKDYNPLLHLPGEYKESVAVETYSLKDAPGVELVVPPASGYAGTPHGLTCTRGWQPASSAASSWLPPTGTRVSASVTRGIDSTRTTRRSS